MTDECHPRRIMPEGWKNMDGAEAQKAFGSKNYPSNFSGISGSGLGYGEP
jgi:hypothetical protein